MVTAILLLSSFSLSGAVPGDEHWDAQFGAPGVSNTVNTVYAVAVNNGMVYVAGYSSAGRTNAPLYLWDGKQWSVPAVFSGPSIMQVNDLLFVGNTLYAAGNFTNVNGVAAYGLAKWDGTSWSSIGFSGVAYALAVEGNNLYVGGNLHQCQWRDRDQHRLLGWERLACARGWRGFAQRLFGAGDCG